LDIKKCVITAAGLGTRLLPASKELPKEMFPIFSINSSGELVIKPLLQVIFERFYNVGVRDFCFIVGRGKRAIEDHFTPDWKFVDELKVKGKSEQAHVLAIFYHKIEDSSILWINQAKPLGFGHAVYSARSFIGDDDFIVAAGDTYVVSKDRDLIRCLIDTFYRTKSSATIFLKKVANPQIYGVVKAQNSGGYLKIIDIIEKTANPPSNIAVTPYYIFRSSIIDVLSKIRSGVGGEIQLTDAIRKLIEKKEQVTGVLLNKDEPWYDVGTPESYSEALKRSKSFLDRTNK
jgi:UTP--glucose-1-phosphate uridylyltransferase